MDYFKDDNFIKIIKQTLNDLNFEFNELNLTKIFKVDAPNSNIKDISGIKYLKNLQKLILNNNNIIDVSELSQLNNLLLVDLDNNEIGDITSLFNLKNLQYLNAENNNIKTLEGIKNCVSLKNIYIKNNCIAHFPLNPAFNIEGIEYQSTMLNNEENKENITISFEDKNFENELKIKINSEYLTKEKVKYIHKLSLNNKNIKSIKGIELLENLENLDLSENNIDNLSILSNLKKLEILNLSNLNIENLKTIPKITSLRKLFISSNSIETFENAENIINIEELFIDNNNIIDLKGIEKLINLTKLNLSNNIIADISLLSNFKLLKKLYISNNNIIDISPLKNMPLKEKLSLDENYITDFSPITDKKYLIYGIDKQKKKINELTKEQKNIINYNIENVLKVNAFAGSGKTTTAIQFIKDIKTNKKVLYIVFNKEAQQNTNNKVIELNLKDKASVLTAHALAYKLLNLKSKNIDLSKYITPMFLKNKYNINYSEDTSFTLILASYVDSYIKFYLNSSYKSDESSIIDSIIEFYNEKEVYQFTEHQIETLTKYILIIIRDIISLNLNYERVTFDIYFKHFHLNIDSYKKYLEDNYEYIIFDEAQDASPVMYDIISNLNIKKIFIGDEHQQIYAFRYAINTLSKIETTEKLNLTKSFRFGNEIAKIANKVLKIKGEKNNISGNEFIHSNITYLGPNNINKLVANNKVFTFIARKNNTLFNVALELANKDKKFILDNFDSKKKSLIDIYNLKMLRKNLITNEMIKSFNNIDSLYKYAIKVEDKDLLLNIKLVYEWDKNFNDNLAKIENFLIKDDFTNSIRLITAHRAKGNEYDNVVLGDDFDINFNQLENNKEEELNIFYVAITRTVKNLYLSENYKKINEITIDTNIKKEEQLQTTQYFSKENIYNYLGNDYLKSQIKSQIDKIKDKEQLLKLLELLK